MQVLHIFWAYTTEQSMRPLLHAIAACLTGMTWISQGIRQGIVRKSMLPGSVAGEIRD